MSTSTLSTIQAVLAVNAIENNVPVTVLSPRGEFQRADETARQMWQRLADKAAKRQASKDAKRAKMRQEVLSRSDALILQDVKDREATVTVQRTHSRTGEQIAAEYLGIGERLNCLPKYASKGYGLAELPLSHPDRKEELVSRAIGGMKSFQARPGNLTSMNSETYLTVDGEQGVIRHASEHSVAGQDVLASILGRYQGGFSKPQGKMFNFLDDTIITQRVTVDPGTGEHRVESSEKLRLWAMLDRAEDFAAMRVAGDVAKSDPLHNVRVLRTGETPYTVLRDMDTQRDKERPEIRELTADVSLYRSTFNVGRPGDSKAYTASDLWYDVKVQPVKDDSGKVLYGGFTVTVFAPEGTFRVKASKAHKQQYIPGTGWTLLGTAPIQDDTPIRTSGTVRTVRSKVAHTWVSDVDAMEVAAWRAKATARFTHPAFPGMVFSPWRATESELYQAIGVEPSTVLSSVATCPTSPATERVQAAEPRIVPEASWYTWRPGIRPEESIPMFYGYGRSF
jgi:hypothetical protein